MLVDLKFRLERLAKADGLCRDGVHQRAALRAGEDRLIDRGAEFLLAKDHAAARAAQGLVRCGGDNVCVGDGRGMQTRCDETGDMRHVDHQISADALRNFADALEIDDARIGGRARYDQLWLYLQRLLGEGIIVDIAVRIDTVGDEVEIFAGHIHRRAVRQMPAMREIHAHDRIAGMDQRKINGHVRLCAGMRLDIGTFCAEQLLGALNGNLFNDIDILAAAIIALARIALRIFVGQYTAHGSHHGRGNEVFGGNQLNIALLAAKLLLHGLTNLRVEARDKADGIENFTVHNV